MGSSTERYVHYSNMGGIRRNSYERLQPRLLEKIVMPALVLLLRNWWKSCRDTLVRVIANFSEKIDHQVL
jgi:hypothetical protein